MITEITTTASVDTKVSISKSDTGPFLVHLYTPGTNTKGVFLWLPRPVLEAFMERGAEAIERADKIATALSATESAQ